MSGMDRLTDEALESHIEALLDAQQDINLAANQHMNQALCDASALLDTTERFLRELITHRRASQPPAPSDGLREAVQALVDRWDSPVWGGSAVNLRHTGEYIAALRTALSASPAQEGEPRHD